MGIPGARFGIMRVCLLLATTSADYPLTFTGGVGMATVLTSEAASRKRVCRSDRNNMSVAECDHLWGCWGTKGEFAGTTC